MNSFNIYYVNYRSSLESQLRMSNWDGKDIDSEVERELHSTQRDRSELRAKVDALQDKIRQLEAEKRAAKSRSKSYERPEKSMYSDSDSVIGASSIRDLKLTPRDSNILKESSLGLHSLGADVSDPLTLLYEQENRELKSKIRRLESQLAEKVNILYKI